MYKVLKFARILLQAGSLPLNYILQQVVTVYEVLNRLRLTSSICVQYSFRYMCVRTTCRICSPRVTQKQITFESAEPYGQVHNAKTKKYANSAYRRPLPAHPPDDYSLFNHQQHGGRIPRPIPPHRRLGGTTRRIRRSLQSRTNSSSDSWIVDEVLVLVGVVQLGALVSRACATPWAQASAGSLTSAVPSVEPRIAGDDDVHSAVSIQ